MPETGIPEEGIGGLEGKHGLDLTVGCEVFGDDREVLMPFGFALPGEFLRFLSDLIMGGEDL